MKIILILCSLILVAAAIYLGFYLKTEDHYGGSFSKAPKVAVSELLAKPTEFLGKQIIIEGDVIDQCPSTGCFFYFDVGGSRLRVELGDLAEKLPQKPGARAIVEGQLVPFAKSYQFLGTAVEFK